MKGNFKDSEYFKWGFTFFCSLAAAIVVYSLFSKIGVVGIFIAKLFKILLPIILGVIFAYLLNPLERYLESHAAKWVANQMFNDNKEHKKFKKAFAIVLTYLIVLLIVVLVIIFVLPNLLESVQILITNVPSYVNSVYEWLKEMFKNSPEITSSLESINSNIMEYLKNIIVPSMDTIANSVATGITGVINGIINVFIGLIASVYLLADKDNFLKGANRILKVILPNKVYVPTMTTLKYSDKVFGGFLIARIIDSLIIAIITFVTFAIFGIPYSILLAVIIGVTNIIPYFGPIIGAVPCGIILFIIDPGKCLTYVILIFLIQQFDGNYLGPKLIGDKTGIKSFWVLFSILLFGGLFGFAGMIFGVPVFAVIYSVVKNAIDKKLKGKKVDA